MGPETFSGMNGNIRIEIEYLGYFCKKVNPSLA